ncbi:hypothetical protein Tco_0706700 [Tanacetum coccineum]|uniref:Zinc knuckle CX2CX4HX4C n=1 Tax=Tanacetum coccineum TaxID=301880 RepID=A0ABQ4Y847_9ASTR
MDASDNSCMDNTSSNEVESVVQQPRGLSESTPLASDGAYKANEANGGNNNMYGSKDNDAGNNKNTPGINMNGSKSDAYGRIGYARALVEINAELELKKEVIMAVPNEDGESYTREVINVEYEWKLPHCIECKTFGHSFTTCLKNVKKSDPITTTADIQEDEFTDVSNRKIKVKRLIVISLKQDQLVVFGFLNQSQVTVLPLLNMLQTRGVLRYALLPQTLLMS